MPERKRAANFTRKEETLVLSLVEKYKDILNNKSSTTGSNTLKAETWRRVSYEYNDINKDGIYRDDKVLRKKYENLKKSLKKHVIDMGVEVDCDRFKLDGDEIVMKIESEDSLMYENDMTGSSADADDENAIEFVPTKIMACVANHKEESTAESSKVGEVSTNKMSFTEAKRAKYLEHKDMANEIKRAHMKEKYKLKLKYMEEKYKKRLEIMENESQLRMRLIKEEFEYRKHLPSVHL